MKIIDINKVRREKETERIAKEAKITGRCICLKCQHEWEGHADQDEWMQCPECGEFFGTWKYPERKAYDNGELIPIWECNCGNNLFHVTQQGQYCPACGNWVE